MRSQEKGQVTPALLLAIVGAFALMTMFLVVTKSQEQSTRSDTAADAAALGAGREYERYTASFLSTMIVTNLPLVPAWVPPTAPAKAAEYAAANGARVLSTTYAGFNPMTLEWRYRVKVRQNDNLRYEGEDKTTTSESVVAVKATGGLCRSGEAGAPGYLVTGVCVGPTQMVTICQPTWTGFPQCPTPAQITSAFEAEMRLVV